MRSASLPGLSSAPPDAVEQPPRCLEEDESSTIFVVDDDRSIREAMRDLLEDDGYSVELFADGRAFLEAYRPGRDGCLLVDALMPGMSGIELIERLKAEGHATAGHRDHRKWRRANGRSSDESGSRRFHREAGRATKICSPASSAHSIRRGMPATLSASRETAATRVASLTARQRQILDSRACRPSKQEHRRRSRHQPAHGRQPSCGHHAQNGLEVPSRAGPHGARCGLSNKD